MRLENYNDAYAKDKLTPESCMSQTRKGFLKTNKNSIKKKCSPSADFAGSKIPAFEMSSFPSDIVSKTYKFRIKNVFGLKF